MLFFGKFVFFFSNLKTFAMSFCYYQIYLWFTLVMKKKREPDSRSLFFYLKTLVTLVTPHYLPKPIFRPYYCSW